MSSLPEKHTPISLTAAHIKIALTALSQVRGYDYDGLAPRAKDAVDRVVSKLSVCKDTAQLFRIEQEQISFVNNGFKHPGEEDARTSAPGPGAAAKVMGLRLISGFVDSICKQTGAIRPPGLSSSGGG